MLKISSNIYEIESKSPLDIFANNSRRLKAKKVAIDDLQNEYNLLERRSFEDYKSNIMYPFFCTEFILNVRDWLDMKKLNTDKEGNKIDKRKNYPEKESTIYISDKLKEFLGTDNLEITNIADYNFHQAYEIKFTSNNHTWELRIPNLDGLKLKHFHDYGESVFKLTLFIKESNHCGSFVGSTFEEEGLKDIFSLGLSKFEEELKNERFS